MTVETDIQKRFSEARPTTRRFLRFSNFWLLAMVVILVCAFLNARAGGLGVYTHPPVWVFLAAHVFALMAALFGGYFYMYALASSKTRSSGILMSAVFYVMTLSALGWGVPSLAVLTGSQKVTVDARVVGASDLIRSRLGSCRHQVYFGPWYASGGNICVGGPKAGALIGTRLVMEGHGNGWATRIYSIESVRS